VQTLPADDPRAADVTDAARAAAQVRDSRFPQVLDVDIEDDTAYVVRSGCLVVTRRCSLPAVH
jgi:hypothetical protein